MRTGSWPSILLIYALGVIAAATISVAIPVLPGIAAQLHLTQLQGGLVISLPAAVLALGALFGGWLVDRAGDKRMLLIGCVVLFVSDLGHTVASTIPELFAARILSGVGYLCIVVAAITMLTRTTTGNRRTSALALWSSFVPVSFMLPLLVASVVSASQDWRWAFYLHAACAALLDLAACMLPPPASRAMGNRANTAGLAAVIRTPAVFWLGMAMAAGGFLQTGVISLLPNVLTQSYLLSFERASQIGTLGMLANGIGCLTTGYLLNRQTAVRTLAFSGVGISFIAAMALFSSHLNTAGVILSSVIFFFAAGLIVGLWALLPRVAPNMQSLGATSGLVTQLALLGVLLGPPFAFAAYSMGDGRLMTLDIVVSSALTLLSMAFIWRRQSAQPEERAALAAK